MIVIKGALPITYVTPLTNHHATADENI